jgi:hypothetical protein
MSYRAESLEDLIVALATHSLALQDVYGLPGEYESGFLDAFVELVVGLAAARRVAEADDIWWCQTRWVGGTVSETGDFCQLCGLPTDRTGCGRRPLLKPEKENR